MYVKWADQTIGVVNEDGTVNFTHPYFNAIIATYTKGRKKWSKLEFINFIQDRVIDKNRRDIERMLFRMNLTHYNELEIAYKTRCINPKDLLWLAHNEAETFEEVVNIVFTDLFGKNVNEVGDSTFSPDGLNIKSYGVFENLYGLFKKRLHPYSTDVESEVAVYNLSRHLGIAVCPAWRVQNKRGEMLSFSKFNYNFTSEYIVHARQFFTKEDRFADEYTNLKHKFPQFIQEIRKMIILDFITRQTDRHLSNFSIKFSKTGTSFYCLYDNGRSLFHEDTGEFIGNAVNDIEGYSSEFGPIGTYYDAVLDISKECHINDLIDSDISEELIQESYEVAGLEGERLEGAVKWTSKTLEKLRSLS